MKFNDHRPFRFLQERRAAAAQARHRWPSAPPQSAPCHGRAAASVNTAGYLVQVIAHASKLAQQRRRD